MRLFLALVLTVSLLAPAYARVHKVHAFTKCRWYSPLFPATGSLARQGAEAERLGLKRIQNDAQLHELMADGFLVTIRSGRAQVVCIKRADYAVLRPWAANLLYELSESEYTVFHRPLPVSSATRPVDYQRRLLRWNRAAAAPYRSVHPVGIAFDIPKSRLSRMQRRWMQFKLWYWQQTGRAIVEEERTCFHVVAILTPTLSSALPE
jgi:hypothetical protein